MRPTGSQESEKNEGVEQLSEEQTCKLVCGQKSYEMTVVSEEFWL